MSISELKQTINQHTLENLNYQEVTLWHDGTAMSDGKCDGVIYRKKGTTYYKMPVSDGYVRPEWWGAVAYGRDAITDDLDNYIKSGLTNSNAAFTAMFATMKTLTYKCILLSGLYYITDTIAIDELADNLTIKGSGDATGFLAKFNDAAKYAITFNKDEGVSVFNLNLRNFYIYLCKDSGVATSYAGGILMDDTIRTNVVNVGINGGYNYITNGLITARSSADKNIFLNNFNNCKLYATTTGNGLHYKHTTYQPTLQNISGCAIHALGGCAIVADMLGVTSGGFGGVIQGNELEGNLKGAIALSAIYGLTVQGNYYECSDYDDMSNFFAGLPKCVWTFGIVNNTSGYLSHVKNLIFTGNKQGASTGTADYAIIFASSKSSGAYTENVTVSDNYFDNNIDKLCPLGLLESVRIGYNKFATVSPLPFDFYNLGSYVVYETKDFRVKFDGVNRYWDYKNGVIDNDNFSDDYPNYPYAAPKATGLNLQYYTGDFIRSSNGTIDGYLCTQSGILKFPTKATITSGTNSLTVTEGAVWDFNTGDIVNNPCFPDGFAAVSSKSGSVLTMSKNALYDYAGWIHHAILIPVGNMFVQGLTSVEKPVLYPDNKLPVVFANKTDKTIEYFINGEWVKPLIANKSAAQADSTATDAAGIVTDFNALLAKLRTAGLLST